MTAILLSVWFIGAGQEKFFGVMPLESGRVVYTVIVEFDSAKSKDDIYMRLKEWAVNNYVSQKDALQTDDKAGGFLAYSGNLLVQAKQASYLVYHTLKFYVKENKYKIVFDDLYTYNLLLERLVGSADKVPIEDFAKGVKQKKHEMLRKELIEIDDVINSKIDLIIKAANSKSSFDF